MYYEINVALNNKHYFATAKRSATDLPTVMRLTKDIKDRFPTSEGYSISVSYHPEAGYSMNINDDTSIIELGLLGK